MKTVWARHRSMPIAVSPRRGVDQHAIGLALMVVHKEQP